jgi:hypothetical protein
MGTDVKDIYQFQQINFGELFFIEAVLQSIVTGAFLPEIKLSWDWNSC